MFIVILLLKEGATRANNIALFANQLMLEFIRSFHFLFASTARYLELVTPSHVVFGVVQGKFLLTPTTFSFLQVQHVTCKKIFAEGRYWCLALLTDFVSPVRLETLHAKPTETMTAWRRHLRVKNRIFAEIRSKICSNVGTQSTILTGFLYYTYQTSHRYWTGRSLRKLTWSNTFFDGESIMKATLHKAGLLVITILLVTGIALRDKGSRPIHVVLS